MNHTEANRPPQRLEREIGHHHSPGRDEKLPRAENDQHDRVEKPGTFITIPYFPGDAGRPSDRPIVDQAVPYLCPGIVIDGTKGLASYTPGVPMSIAVEVVNHGYGSVTAPVHVVVWWSDPTTGFAKIHPLCQSTMLVPADGLPRTSPPMSAVIPKSAPAHVCLLARVSAPLDMAPSSPILPAVDRHWAQLNLMAASGAPGQPFQLVFIAGNPFAFEAAFSVVTRPVFGTSLSAVERTVKRDLVPVRELRLSVGDARRQRHEGAVGESVNLILRPSERRPMIITGVVPNQLRRGDAFAIEVVQATIGRDEPSQQTGAIGVIVAVA